MTVVQAFRAAVAAADDRPAVRLPPLAGTDRFFSCLPD
jgi:hypothetical protein